MRILSYRPTVRAGVILALLALVMTVVACSAAGEQSLERRNESQLELAKRAGVAAPAAGAAAPSTPAGGASAGAPAAGGDPVKLGAAAAQTYGCAACHSITGTAGIGPTWKGLAGSKVDLADGSSVTADDAYLTESILNPGAKVVKGFANGIMPQDISKQFKPGDLENLIAYIKSLK